MKFTFLPCLQIMRYLKKHDHLLEPAMLNHKEPSFLAENQSIVSLVSQLHGYFKNTHSLFETEQGTLVSQLHAVGGNQEPERLEELRQELRKIDAELALFGALSDALSVADRLLHAHSVMNELGLNSQIYTLHQDSEHDL